MTDHALCSIPVNMMAIYIPIAFTVYKPGQVAPAGMKWYSNAKQHRISTCVTVEHWQHSPQPVQLQKIYNSNAFEEGNITTIVIGK